MSDNHTAHDVSKHVRGYLIVFGALLIGTVLTVWASHFHFGNKDSNVGNIVVALIIALTKAFLVAGYFMHLISEKKLIYSVLAFTGFFFAGLMFLTLWSMHPQNIVHFK
ncbi:MAG: cytochrome C oxidase subunit IV family protein [Verrucomicrobiota bacterium]